MLKIFRSLAVSVAFVAALALAAPGWAQATDAAASTVPITTVVTVLGDHGAPSPPVPQNEITVYSGKTRLDVIKWVRARGPSAHIQLAILIDNSDGIISVGSQLDELARFIEAQPPHTEVGLFYATAESAQTAAPFSTDHHAVAQALHLPLGWRNANSPSVYLSLSNLIRKWPGTAPRREVLLICSGIDHLHPGIESPYVDSAIEDAEKAGVVVHTLYSAGERLALSQEGNVAQMNLTQFADGTGGAILYQGLMTPVSYGPFLEQLDLSLKNQYLLTFAMEPAKKAKGELRPIRIRTEQHGLKLSYPQEVFVPSP